MSLPITAREIVPIFPSFPLQMCQKEVVKMDEIIAGWMLKHTGKLNLVLQ